MPASQCRATAVHPEAPRPPLAGDETMSGILRTEGVHAAVDSASADQLPPADGFLDAEAFKRVFRQHPAGVAVITLRTEDGGLVGLTATSVISVSADPPVLAFSVAASSSSWPALARASSVAVSFLADDQPDVATRFATHDTDRFAGGGWSVLHTGEPVIDGAAAWIRGEVLHRIPVGQSYLVSVLASTSGNRPGASTIVYRDRKYHRLDADSAL